MMFTELNEASNLGQGDTDGGGRGTCCPARGIRRYPFQPWWTAARLVGGVRQFVALATDRLFMA